MRSTTIFTRSMTNHKGLFVDLNCTWKKISSQGKNKLFESVTDVRIWIAHKQPKKGWHWHWHHRSDPSNCFNRMGEKLKKMMLRIKRDAAPIFLPPILPGKTGCSLSELSPCHVLSLSSSVQVNMSMSIVNPVTKVLLCTLCLRCYKVVTVWDKCTLCLRWTTFWRSATPAPSCAGSIATTLRVHLCYIWILPQCIVCHWVKVLWKLGESLIQIQDENTLWDTWWVKRDIQSSLLGLPLHPLPKAQS